MFIENITTLESVRLINRTLDKVSRSVTKQMHKTGFRLNGGKISLVEAVDYLAKHDSFSTMGILPQTQAVQLTTNALLALQWSNYKVSTNLQKVIKEKAKNLDIYNKRCSPNNFWANVYFIVNYV